MYMAYMAVRRVESTTAGGPGRFGRTGTTLGSVLRRAWSYGDAVSTNHGATRALLENERAQLLRRIDELTIGGEVDMEYDDDFADRGQVTGERGANRTVADALQQQVAQVDRALAQIEHGTYGTCDVCGRPIETARLEALPATDRCITHA